MLTKFIGRAVLVTGLALMIGACGAKPASVINHSEQPDPTGKPDSINGTPIKLGDPGSVGDGYSIEDVRVNGDTLMLSVRYSGGCQDHDFDLYWDESFLESNPVQANLVLTHDANEDTCEALRFEELTFDLAALRDSYVLGYRASSGTMILNIAEHGGSVDYDFITSSADGAAIKVGTPGDTGDGYTISNAVVQGDSLKLTVRYGGGCEEHDFDLYWDESFLESYPVQANLVLTHDANGDTCEAYLSKELTFDLSSLKDSYLDGYQAGSGTIFINIADDGGSVEYTFTGATSNGAAITLGTPESTGDGYMISDVAIQGDSLKLTVRYGGGCEEHDFELYWDESFLESYPVQANLVLTHDGHGDFCEALLIKELSFDLSSLKASYLDGYQAGIGAIILNIRDDGGQVNYVF